MDVRIFTEPQQGASYDELLAVARRTEELGFSGFFRSDHYLRMGDGDPGYGPTDAWTTLAGLARDTSTIRLGTLVSSVTYRLPGILAVQVANVDDMSQGRVELGLGTGWFREEHEAFGIPFPAKRFDLLEEQLEIVRGLWETPRGETFSYDGRAYQLTDNPGLPKPVQDPLPIVVGGKGRSRTPALAARFAQDFNIPFPDDLDEVRDLFDRVRSACADIGRTDIPVLSVALVVCIGRDEAEFVRRAAAIGREPDELRANGLAGTVDEIRARLAEFRDAGAERVYLQVLDLRDLEHLDVIADVVGGAA